MAALGPQSAQARSAVPRPIQVGGELPTVTVVRSASVMRENDGTTVPARPRPWLAPEALHRRA
jgi:hypothetical protein